MDLACLIEQGLELFEIGIAFIRLAVADDSVKAFDAVAQRLGKLQVGLADETDGMQALAQAEVRLFNALGDVDLLLTGE